MTETLSSIKNVLINFHAVLKIHSWWNITQFSLHNYINKHYFWLQSYVWLLNIPSLNHRFKSSVIF